MKLIINFFMVDLESFSQSLFHQQFTGTTVDGWNPAPPGMYKTL